MKTQAIQKINKIGKISSVITLIAKILVGMGIVLSLLGTIICFVIPESLLKLTIASEVIADVDLSGFGEVMTEDEMATVRAELESGMGQDGEMNFTDVEVTEHNIVMRGDSGEVSFTMRDLAWLVVLGLAALVMTFVTLIFIGRLCKAFRDCRSPFEENVIRKMQHLAISLIPWTIVSTLSNSVSDSITNNKLSLNFTVDLGVVLVVLIVLVLVYIFKYGAVLQQESDETL